MDAVGVQCRSISQREYFKFGPGVPLLSGRAWCYTVGINGTRCEVVTSEVDADVPGLVGPDEMAEWDAAISFRNGTFTANDVTKL